MNTKTEIIDMVNAAISGESPLVGKDFSDKLDELYNEGVSTGGIEDYHDAQVWHKEDKKICLNSVAE